LLIPSAKCGDKLRHILVTFQSSKPFDGFEDGGGDPPQDHLTAAPPFDIPLHVTRATDEAFDGVGGRERLAQTIGQAERRHRQRFLQAFPVSLLKSRSSSFSWAAIKMMPTVRSGPEWRLNVQCARPGRQEGLTNAQVPFAIGAPLAHRHWVAPLRSSAFVMVVPTTEVRDRDNAAVAERFGGSRDRGILVQRKVGSKFQVVLDVRG